MRKSRWTGMLLAATVSAWGVPALFAADTEVVKTEKVEVRRDTDASAARDKIAAPGAIASTGAVQKASKLIGAEVYNNENKHIGEIKDLVLDTERGRIAYAVLGFGGFMNLGEKYFAIPFTALQYQPDPNAGQR